MKTHIPNFSSFRFQVSSFVVLLLALCGTASAQWLLDGRKLVTATDPQAAADTGTNTVYQTTNAVARWIALTNGLALEVHSSTGWVRQAEYTEE